MDVLDPSVGEGSGGLPPPPIELELLEEWVPRKNSGLGL